MNAIEYVKKNGIEKSKIHLDRMKQERWINSFFNELKQIVDAFELVGSHGGLRRAKLSCGYPSSDKSGTVGRLNNAITLVEQCK